MMRAMAAAMAAAALVACGGGEEQDDGVQVVQPVGTRTAGFWRGTAGPYELGGVTLPSGELVVIYSTGNLVEGAVLGQINGTSATTFDAAITDYNVRLLSVTPGTFSGTYVRRETLNGTVRVGSTVQLPVALQYDSSYEQPAQASTLAGTWRVTTASPGGVISGQVSIGADGTFAVSTPFCSGSGVATPRTDANLFDLTVRFNGGNCEFAGQTLTGSAAVLAGYSPRRLYAAALTPDGRSGFFTIGTQ